LKNPIWKKEKKASEVNVVATKTQEEAITFELCKKFVRDCDFEQLMTIIQKDPELEGTINQLLREYYLFVTTKLIEWVGKFNQMQIFFNTNINRQIQACMTNPELIQAINENMGEGQKLGQELIEYMKTIYYSIRSLLDQDLPEKSVVVGYAEKILLEQKTPWVAIEALYFALNNWKRQYGKETGKIYHSLLLPISEVYKQIQINDYVSLEPEVQIIIQQFHEQSTYFENLSTSYLDKTDVDLVELGFLELKISEFFTIFNLILTILRDRLVSENNEIDQLSLIKNEERTQRLLGNLDRARKKIEIPSNRSINQNLAALSKSITQANQALDVLLAYYRRKELLLNYPNAKIAIKECLKSKSEVTPQDLPFPLEFGENFIKMYRSEKR
jgi:hypothetical protein